MPMASPLLPASFHVSHSPPSSSYHCPLPAAQPRKQYTATASAYDDHATMILADLFSILLRLAELAFAAIVAGLNGAYLHAVHNASSWQLGRFIYTEVVAGLSIFLAIIWLIPFSGSFIHWPVDFVISVAWFVSFGLLVDWLGGNCG